MVTPTFNLLGVPGRTPPPPLLLEVLVFLSLSTISIPKLFVFIQDDLDDQESLVLLDLLPPSVPATPVRRRGGRTKLTCYI